MALSKPAQGLLTGIGELFVGTAIVTIALLFFSYLGSQVLDKQAFVFDSSIQRMLYDMRSPLMTSVMLGITFLGSGFFLGGATIVVISYLLWKQQRRSAFVFSFLLFFGVLLNLLLKSIFQRARPDFLPLVNEPTFSFPSGHSMNSMIFFAAISYFIFYRMNHTRIGKLCIALSVVLIFLIGISRIYLGAHYPTDVVAGYLAGLLWFFIVVFFEKSISFLDIFRIKSREKK